MLRRIALFVLDPIINPTWVDVAIPLVVTAAILLLRLFQKI